MDPTVDPAYGIFVTPSSPANDKWLSVSDATPMPVSIKVATGAQIADDPLLTAIQTTNQLLSQLIQLLAGMATP